MVDQEHRGDRDCRRPLLDLDPVEVSHLHGQQIRGVEQHLGLRRRWVQLLQSVEDLQLQRTHLAVGHD